MLVFALLAALQTSTAPSQDIFTSAKTAAEESQPPAAPLSEEQRQSYIRSLAETPDALAISIDKDGQLRRIFAPYFQCYRNALNADRRSNLRNATSALEAFQHAYDVCGSVRLESEAEAHKFAASFPELNDPVKRQMVIDYYRSWQGRLMLRDYYERRGRLVRFNQIADEMNSNQRVVH